MASPFSLYRRLTTSAAAAAARALRSANHNSSVRPLSRNAALVGFVFQQVTPNDPHLLPPNPPHFSSPSTATAWATTGTNDSKFHLISSPGFSGSWPLLAKPHLLTLPRAELSVLHRPFSSTTEPPGPSGTPQEREFKHQEIEGPTVEPDNSALANETRQVLEAVRRAVYDLSSVLVLLAAIHLAIGAWVATHASERAAVAQGVAAFAFPFVTAFLMRRTLKPLGFFTKMEQQGRLQVLTLALQVTKHLRTLFLRVRVLAMFCAAGLSVGSVSAVWFH